MSEGAPNGNDGNGDHREGGEGGGSFNLFVKSINGKTRTLTVNRTDTIRAIKDQIQEKEGIAPEEQRLIFAGKNLEDTKTIAEFSLLVFQPLFKANVNVDTI